MLLFLFLILFALPMYGMDGEDYNGSFHHSVAKSRGRKAHKKKAELYYHLKHGWPIPKQLPKKPAVDQDDDDSGEYDTSDDLIERIQIYVIQSRSSSNCSDEECIEHPTRVDSDGFSYSSSSCSCSLCESSQGSPPGSPPPDPNKK